MHILHLPPAPDQGGTARHVACACFKLFSEYLLTYHFYVKIRTISIQFYLGQCKARPFNFQWVSYFFISLFLYLFISFFQYPKLCVMVMVTAKLIFLCSSSPLLHWPTFCMQNVYRIFHFIGKQSVKKDENVSFSSKMSVMWWLILIPPRILPMPFVGIKSSCF